MRKWLALLFLLCALPTGTGIALLTPINMFSDEPVHIARADGLRYGEVLGVPQPNAPPGTPRRAGVIITAGMFNVLLTREWIEAFPDHPVSEAARKQTESVTWDNRPAYFPTQMVEYFPIFYAPAALGLLVGEKTGLTPLHAVYLGRLAMLLAYVLLGTAAVALARRGAGLMFAVLTLPAAINLGSSFNQDGVMIACCALAAALLTRGTGPSRSWCVGLAALICVISAKTPYAALLLFCLPPLFGAKIWRRTGIVLLAAVLPGLWLLHTMHNGFIPYFRPAYHPGPLWPGDGAKTWFTNSSPRDNLRVLLAHPAQVFILPLYSLAVFWHATWPFILGGMGAGTLLVPGWELPLLIFSLAAAACGCLRDGAATPPPGGGLDAFAAFLALFGGFIGMELALYLTCTGVGLPYIEGVSARYFLPLMPFFSLLLPWPGAWAARFGAKPLANLPAVGFVLPAAALAMANAVVLPGYISHVFRMPWP